MITIQTQAQNRDQDEAIELLMLALGGLVLTLATLPALVFALVMVLVYRRLPWVFFAGIMLGVLIAGLIVVHAAGGLTPYVTIYTQTLLDGLRSGSPHWPSYFSGILVFGPPLTLAALVFLVARPASSGFRINKRIKNVQGPLERLILKKQSKQRHPPGRTRLGISERNSLPVLIDDRELNQHCFICGTTGSGKTVTLLNFAESAIQREVPLVYVDAKGESKLVDQLMNMAEKNGRKFYLFSISGHPAGCRWNPLARGGATELKDKLISLSEWSEPHYRFEAERYLQAVFATIEAFKIRPDLVTIARYLNPETAVALAAKLYKNSLREKLIQELRAGKTVEGLANRIAVLAASEIGCLFKDNEADKPLKKKDLDLSKILGLPGQQKPEKESAPDARQMLDLDQAISENAVVLFSLNSLRFRDFSQLIGRLVVNDLRTTIARRYDQLQRDYVFGIFDEFHIFASLQVVDILAQARAAGFCTLIATQSLSDLDLVDRNLTGRIVENCNTFIVQGQNYPDNAERLAAVIGTRESIAETIQVQRSGLLLQQETGLGSERDTRQFVIHPDEIKQLTTGEAVLVRKVKGYKAERIRIRKPNV